MIDQPEIKLFKIIFWPVMFIIIAAIFFGGTSTRIIDRNFPAAKFVVVDTLTLSNGKFIAISSITDSLTILIPHTVDVSIGDTLRLIK